MLHKTLSQVFERKPKEPEQQQEGGSTRSTQKVESNPYILIISSISLLP